MKNYLILIGIGLFTQSCGPSDKPAIDKFEPKMLVDNDSVGEFIRLRLVTGNDTSLIMEEASPLGREVLPVMMHQDSILLQPQRKLETEKPVKFPNELKP